VTMDLPHHGVVWAVPRLVLYESNQPGQCHMLGRKIAGCHFPCSTCMKYENHVATESTGAGARCVLKPLDKQLEAPQLFDTGGRPGWVEQLPRQVFLSPSVPVHGAMYGLETGSLLEQRQQRPHRAASELFKSATYANV